MKPELIPKLRRTSVPRQTGADALVTTLSACVDRSLMQAVNLMVERRVLPRKTDLDGLRESVRAMIDSNLPREPEKFFDFVEEIESGKSAPQELRTEHRRRIRGGHIVRRSLESAYGNEAGCSGGQNGHDPIRFEHWMHHPGGAHGTVIVLHGFAMGWPVIDARVMSAQQWFKQGLDVVLLTLPDHGPRRSQGAVFSGQSYTVPHAIRLAGAVRRAVFEIFELKKWLRDVEEMPIGLIGMSLGGYLASLCAGLSDDFDFLIPLVPPACMGDLAWRVYRDTSHHRAGYDEILTEDNMRAAFYVHSPLAHPRRIQAQRILIAAGAGDRIVPPEHPTALWEHWDKPDIHWFRGSHMAPAVNNTFVDVASRHLRRLAILPQ